MSGAAGADRPALLADAVATLRAYAPTGGQQRSWRAAYLRHLDEHPDGVWREGPPVHLTASCIVLDPRAEQVLLTLHRKGGFWVQPGGHLERGDATIAAAALREATEESGLGDLALLPSGAPAPVGLHRHALSAAFGRCREHLDVTYAAVANLGAPTVVSDESHDVAWWPVGRLPPTTVPDLAGRLAAVVAAVRAAA